MHCSPVVTRTLAIAGLLLACSPPASPARAPFVPKSPAPEAQDALMVKPIVGRYRGFNLQGMYKLEWNKASGYKERDFQILSELGFNYARLPIDYKTYTKWGDWLTFLPEKLALIDQAVAWGQQYGVHISINLHQAPGYCVHDPASLKISENQRLDLWSDAEAQAVFVRHWTMFAERYAKVPASHLSFNLINEPGEAGGPENYARIMLRAVAAIRATSPERPIEVDGLSNGTRVVDSLLDAGLRQAVHAYEPHGLTHYAADWVPGSKDWPVPVWPPTRIPKFLYGANKAADGLQSPMVIRGSFPAGTRLEFEVAQVSIGANLELLADDKLVWEHAFKPGKGIGEWAQVVYNERYKIYQNVYNRRYNAVIDKESKRITLRVKAGDWLTLNRIELRRGGESSTIAITPGISTWGIPQAIYEMAADGRITPVEFPNGHAEEFQNFGYLRPWIRLKQSGHDVIVGEFGVYKETPHDTTLRFLEELLTEFRDADLGWAMWDFDGDFGPFNSGRKDVTYEAYRGYQMDRKMMDLLRRY